MAKSKVARSQRRNVEKSKPRAKLTKHEKELIEEIATQEANREGLIDGPAARRILKRFEAMARRGS